jgi:Domain of unknown function (DUF4412)
MCKQILLFLFCVSVLVIPTFGQSPFEGIVTYNIKVKGDNAAMTAAFMPTEMVLKTKGTAQRTYVNGLMPQDILTINGQSYLLDHGKKTAEKLPNDANVKEKKTYTTKITPTKIVAKIAGYSCKKVIMTITSKGNNQLIELWVTDKINIAANQLKVGMLQSLDGLKGFPLKIASSIKMQNLSPVMFEFFATSVAAKTLPASEFEIPTGYTVFSSATDEISTKQNVERIMKGNPSK